MNEEYAIPQLKETWIQHSVTMLEEGYSQISIITFLRSQGIGDELAKELSYDVFAVARKRVLRKFLLHRIFAWSIILIGIPLLLITGALVSLSFSSHCRNGATFQTAQSQKPPSQHASATCLKPSPQTNQARHLFSQRTRLELE